MHEDINIECSNPDHWIRQKILPILDYKKSSITVCFISFATFDDDVTLKVLKIIKFGKKFLKDDCLAFFQVQFLEIFEKNLMLSAHN